MSDSSSAVSAAPFIDALAPYIVAVGVTVVTAAIGWAAQQFSKMTGINIDAQHLANLKSAAASEAGALLAADAQNLAGKTFNIGSPEVAAIVNRIGARFPDAVKALAPTPNALATIVAGEIGKLQAQQPAAAAK